MVHVIRVCSGGRATYTKFGSKEELIDAARTDNGYTYIEWDMEAFTDCYNIEDNKELYSMIKNCGEIVEIGEGNYFLKNNAITEYQYAEQIMLNDVESGIVGNVDECLAYCEKDILLNDIFDKLKMEKVLNLKIGDFVYKAQINYDQCYHRFSEIEYIYALSVDEFRLHNDNEEKDSLKMDSIKKVKITRENQKNILNWSWIYED